MTNTCSETQGFGENANSSYASGGLKGHTGIDVNCGFDTPIHANYDGYVYKILDDKHPAADGYWMVSTLCQSGDGPSQWHEHSYGHVNKILVKEGDFVKRGDLIATEGNHGIVYQGGELITLAMQAAGDTRGHHRHYQDRPLVRVVGTVAHETYLSGWGQEVYRDKEDYCFLIPNYTNGFNGCCAFPVTDIYDLYPPQVTTGPVIVTAPAPELPPEVEKTVEQGIEVAKNLGKYPQFRQFAIAILAKLSSILSLFLKPKK